MKSVELKIPKEFEITTFFSLSLRHNFIEEKDTIQLITRKKHSSHMVLRGHEEKLKSKISC